MKWLQWSLIPVVLLSLGCGGGTAPSSPPSSAAVDEGTIPQLVPPITHSDWSLAQLRNYQSIRLSSYDRNGGNLDFVILKPGENFKLPEITGPGVIRHIWFTFNAPEECSLRKIVVRMFWDGEESPSVEAPLGDFFGLGHCQYDELISAMIQSVPDRSLNCFFPMPFAKSARIEMENQGQEQVLAFYYHVDYEKYDRLPDNLARFHATWHYAQPVQNSMYHVLEATGAGHFLGLTMSVRTVRIGWWGEGDDLVYIDGAKEAQVHGTGSEDCFGGAWMINRPFMTPNMGCIRIDNAKPESQLYSMYRFFLESPIAFQKSIRIELEHDRWDDFSSVAYWYQTEPHIPLAPLPPWNLRLPRGTTYAMPAASEAQALLTAAQVEPSNYEIVASTFLSPAMNQGNFVKLLFKADKNEYTVPFTADKGGKQLVLQLLNGPAGAAVQLNLDGKDLGGPLQTEAKHESLMLPVELPADISAGQHQLKISRTAMLKPMEFLRWDFLAVKE